MSKDATGISIKAICVLLAVTLVPGLIGLGGWQLQRAEQKRRIIEQAQTGGVSGELAGAREAPSLPQAVVLDARLASDRLLLLDNRTREGRAGYELLALFQDLSSGRWGIVNLGWLAAGADRNQLPQLILPVTLSDQTLRLSGMLVSAQAGYQLAVDEWQPGWPKRIQQPDMARFEALYKRPLYAAMLRLTEPVKATGLTQLNTRWPLVNMLPQKHLGYAVQWFALALALLIWLGWFGWWRHPSRSEPGARSNLKMARFSASEVER